MASLQNGLERIDEKINKLITLNQKTYLRENKDEGDIKPTGTSWNLENQNEMLGLPLHRKPQFVNLLLQI